MRDAVFVVAVCAVVMGSCNERECTLDVGPLLELRLVPIVDIPISSVSIAASYAGERLPAFGCGEPKVLDTSQGDGCRSLWVPISDLSVSGTLELSVEAGGYAPAHFTADVRSDGCHLLPGQRVDVDLRATIDFACESWCSKDIECTPDVDWDLSTCIDFCKSDLSGETPDDRCDERYADLYFCEAQLPCEEYSTGGPTCAGFETAVDACEA
ncbi:MAG: hypothetical protein IPK74_26565 [Deltaproteobacteria bacterium]|nr:hypothetical protein [Deltaproteobacteria bacterium]